MSGVHVIESPLNDSAASATECWWREGSYVLLQKTNTSNPVAQRMPRPFFLSFFKKAPLQVGTKCKIKSYAVNVHMSKNVSGSFEADSAQSCASCARQKCQAAHV